MKISAALVALATIVVLFQDSSAKSYKNHKVVTFTIEDETQLKEVQSLQSFSGVRNIFGCLTFNLNLKLLV